MRPGRDVDFRRFILVKAPHVHVDAALGLRVGREPSAGRDREVDLGCRPTGVARSVKGEAAGDRAHGSNTGGRFHVRDGGSSEEEDQKKQAFCEKAHRSKPENFALGGQRLNYGAEPSARGRSGWSTPVRHCIVSTHG
jgi:hypothetical protein